ncbi:hypothetical protein E2C01_022909 [Portunus trituberculatus]|uniref:Uncharacterized protein n=1 Tax=Portunus trituberculatus TaxID=210409 RepID=A0A5B7EA56_PORTR|nr:hypothetical protein [Portunus trituberculatus]
MIQPTCGAESLKSVAKCGRFEWRRAVRSSSALFTEFRMNLIDLVDTRYVAVFPGAAHSVVVGKMEVAEAAEYNPW